MLGRAIGATVAALLFMACFAFPALPQTAGGPGAQSAAPAAAPKAPRKARTAKPKAASPEAAAKLEYPPCSKTAKDHCIQLWQKDLGKAYPQCAKLRNPTARAACIETSFKQGKP